MCFGIRRSVCWYIGTYTPIYKSPYTCIQICAVSCHRVPVYQHVLYRVTVCLYINMCCIMSLCSSIPTCAVSCQRVPVYQPTCAVSCHCVPVYQHVLIMSLCSSTPTCAVSCHRVPVYQHVLYRVTLYLYTNMCCNVSPCTCILTCAVSCHRVPVY